MHGENLGRVNRGRCVEEFQEEGRKGGILMST